MSLWSWLFGRPAAPPRPSESPPTSGPSSRVQARYDASQTNDQNKRHWAAADALSAAAANSLDVRKKLRERMRLERANNGYCAGLIETMANDLIGTGPTLQVLFPERADANRQIEEAFSYWMRMAGLAEKLHTFKQAKSGDGEAVGLLTSNPLYDQVQLDVLPIECDQLTTPDPLWGLKYRDTWVDGIEFDAARNPVRYHVLKNHPGDLMAGRMEYDRLDRKFVLHWFRCNRPGQARGIPELTPSLPLFAQLRRYTVATLLTAELQSRLTGVLETEAPEDDEDEEDDGTEEPFKEIALSYGTLTTTPKGAKLHAFDPKQPSTMYESFKRELLKEIGRPVNAPFCVVAGDSSPYNYSSARMDFLLYRNALRVERQFCVRHLLDRILAAWLEEAANIPGLLPKGIDIRNLPHTWFWPGHTTIDPQKEAAADSERLDNGTGTLAELCSAEGKNWEDTIRQRAREKKLAQDVAKEFGLEPEPSKPAKRQQPDEPEVEKGEDQDGARPGDRRG